MNPADTIAKGAQSIAVEYDLPQPPDVVWRALTEPKLLAAWLMPNDIKPEVGHCFTFRAAPVPGWDGTVHCEVLVVEPNRLLRYSWRGGSDKLEQYGAKLDTVVTWTLTPTAGGTRLRLDHDGFPLESFAFTKMNQGWRGKVAERIAQVLVEAA
jgi:uncharacterized protein YndB with AHSA1/START domain